MCITHVVDWHSNTAERAVYAWILYPYLKYPCVARVTSHVSKPGIYSGDMQKSKAETDTEYTDDTAHAHHTCREGPYLV